MPIYDITIIRSICPQRWDCIGANSVAEKMADNIASIVTNRQSEHLHFADLFHPVGFLLKNQLIRVELQHRTQPQSKQHLLVDTFRVPYSNSWYCCSWIPIAFATSVCVILSSFRRFFRISASRLIGFFMYYTSRWMCLYQTLYQQLHVKSIHKKWWRLSCDMRYIRAGSIRALQSQKYNQLTVVRPYKLF